MERKNLHVGIVRLSGFQICSHLGEPVWKAFVVQSGSQSRRFPKSLVNKPGWRTPRCGSFVALLDPRTATNGQLAEFLRDLIRHSIKFLLTRLVGLIEECLL